MAGVTDIHPAHPTGEPPKPLHNYKLCAKLQPGRAYKEFACMLEGRFVIIQLGEKRHRYKVIKQALDIGEVMIFDSKGSFNLHFNFCPN